MLLLLKSWLSRPLTWVLLAAAGLVVLASLALATCDTRPAGLYSPRQQRVQAAAGARALGAAQALRAQAQRYEDSAITRARHEKPVSLPAADSGSLPEFWAKFFATPAR